MKLMSIVKFFTLTWLWK